MSYNFAGKMLSMLTDFYKTQNLTVYFNVTNIKLYFDNSTNLRL